MDFVESVKTCLQKKYAEFEGRATRSEFWWFALFSIIVNFVLGAILPSIIGALVSLALLVPSLAVGSRRLHDIGKSGWLQLLWLIPLVGWAILIYWAVQPSGPANEYGGMMVGSEQPTGMPPSGGA